MSHRLPASVSADTAPVAVPLSVVSRVGTALGHHARGLWLDPGRLLHSLWYGRPGSMAGLAVHVRSLAWVPPEMTGKPRAFWAAAGIAYQVTIGWLLRAIGNSLSAAAPHPLAGLAIVVFAITLIVLL